MKRLATIIALTVASVLTSNLAAQAQHHSAPNYRFGMSIVLTSNGQQKGLYVKTISHGGPACRAGLKVGDVIIKSNGYNFDYARDNYHAVEMLKSTVVMKRDDSVPTTAGYGHQEVPTALMEVIRHGRLVYVCVHPERVGCTLPPPVVWKPVTPPYPPFKPGCSKNRCSGPGKGVPTTR